MRQRDPSTLWDRRSDWRWLEFFSIPFCAKSITYCCWYRRWWDLRL